MSAQIRLSGPDANMAKDEYRELIEQAKSLDPVKVNELLAKVFIHGPNKNVEEKSDEELAQFQYAMEETVRFLRTYLGAVAIERDIRRKKNSQKQAEMDRKYKPAKIAPHDRADVTPNEEDADIQSAMSIAEIKDIPFEDALLFVKGKITMAEIKAKYEDKE